MSGKDLVKLSRALTAIERLAEMSAQERSDRVWGLIGFCIFVVMPGACILWQILGSIWRYIVLWFGF